MISKYAAVAAVGLLCLAGQASATGATAAQLSAVKGSVMVSQGAAFAKAGAGAALKAGDRVVASDNSSAELRYADGCVVTLAPQAVATVGAKSPCADTGLVRASQSMQFNDAGALLPTVVVGAIIVFGIMQITDNDPSPQSP